MGKEYTKNTMTNNALNVQTPYRSSVVSAGSLPSIEEKKLSQNDSKIGNILVDIWKQEMLAGVRPD